jgi:hypothetical protein
MLASDDAGRGAVVEDRLLSSITSPTTSTFSPAKEFTREARPLGLMLELPPPG